MGMPGLCRSRDRTPRRKGSLSARGDGIQRQLFRVVSFVEKDGETLQPTSKGSKPGLGRVSWSAKAREAVWEAWGVLLKEGNKGGGNVQSRESTEGI